MISAKPAPDPGPGSGPDSGPEPLPLSRRLGLERPLAAGATLFTLSLTAEERTRLRGLRHSRCGRPLLLQLPRGEALMAGEWLAPAGDGALVQVEPAPEPLLHVTAATPHALLQAAYHLGNRHVAIEIRPGALRLLQDPVLAHLLRHRGLEVEPLEAPFLPEPGAYGPAGSHGHSHTHAG